MCRDQHHEQLREAVFNAACRAYGVTIFFLILAYLLSGITFVEPGEIVLVQRLGRWVRDGESIIVNRPGLLLAWPAPVDTVIRVPIQQELLLAIDAFRDSSAAPAAEATATDEDEGPASIPPLPVRAVLTGDQNILQLRAIARLRVVDPASYTASYVDPDQTIRNLMISAITTTVCGWQADDVLRLHRDRESLADAVMAVARTLLTRAQLGVELTGLEFEEITPPQQIRAAFLAVHEARVGQDALREEARVDAAEQLAAHEILARQYIADARGKESSRPAQANRDIALFDAALAAAEGPLGMTVQTQLRQETWRELIRQAGQAIVVPVTPGPATLRLSLPSTEDSQ